MHANLLSYSLSLSHTHTHVLAYCEHKLAATRQAVRAKVQTNWVITHSSKTHGRNDGQDENELWEWDMVTAGRIYLE